MRVRDRALTCTGAFQMTRVCSRPGSASGHTTSHIPSGGVKWAVGVCYVEARAPAHRGEGQELVHEARQQPPLQSCAHEL